MPNNNNKDEIKNTKNIEEAIKQQTDATKKLADVTKNAMNLLKKFGEAQAGNTNATKKHKKAVDELSESVKDLEKNSYKLKQVLSDSKDVFFGVFGVESIKVTGSLVKNVFKLESELHRSLVLAGKGKKEIKEYKNSYKELSASMGATYEESKKIVSKFAELQYVGSKQDLDKVTKSTYALSKAYGLNADEVASNSVELQKWGGLSADTTTAMYADIMKVSKATGLTKNGVTAVMKATTQWSGMLRAFGKAPADVQKYNLSLTKTVSALEKVGISASETTRLIEELTDPTKIEDNISKYTMLGISISDAISGNIDPEKAGEGLKAFGEKLKQMGPIAGAQYAQAMGISYKDAMKAASADMAEASQVEMTPEAKASEELRKSMEETKNVVEKINSMFEKIGGTVRKVFGVVLPFLFNSIITRFAIPKLGKIVSKNIEKIADETAPAFFNKFRQEFKKFRKETVESWRKDETRQNKAKGKNSEILKKNKNSFKGVSKNKFDRQAERYVSNREKIRSESLAKQTRTYDRNNKNLNKTLTKGADRIEKKLNKSSKSIFKSFKDGSKSIGKSFNDAIKKLKNLKIKTERPGKARTSAGDLIGSKVKMPKLGGVKSTGLKGLKGIISIFKGGAGLVKGIFGLVKSIFKSLGPIGIALGVVLLIMKIISPIMERIKSNLLPILQPALDLFKQKVAPYIEKIGRAIEKVVKWLTKAGITAVKLYNQLKLFFEKKFGNKEAAAKTQNTIEMLDNMLVQLEKSNLLAEKKEKEEGEGRKERLVTKNGGDVYVRKGEMTDSDTSATGGKDEDEETSKKLKDATASTSVINETSTETQTFMDEMYNINNSLLEQFRLSVEYSRQLIDLFKNRNNNAAEDVNRGVKKALKEKVHVEVDNYKDFKAFSGGK